MILPAIDLFVFLGCSNEFKYANPPTVFDWNNIDTSQVGKATSQIRINETDICKNKTGMNLKDAYRRYSRK